MKKHSLTVLALIVGIVIGFSIDAITTKPVEVELKHKISLTEALEMQNNLDAFGKDIKFNAGEEFDAGEIASILNRKGVEKLAVYYGAHEDGTFGIILSALDERGNRLEPLLERSTCCPVALSREVTVK